MPPAVVTVMSTMPAPVPVAALCARESAVMAAVVTVLGGLVTVIWVAESAVIVPATPPKRTTVAPASPVPVMVTAVPPVVVPLAGDTPVTAGSVTGPDLWVTATTRMAATPTLEAAMADLIARERRSRECRTRRCRRVSCTVLPWTAGGPPDGHRAASSRAASPRKDRPRSRQSGP